ncbi:uncharacterized protein [Euphorbia lathyris]|uniref:uncharacterized protein n=1 Tax=Euphorbia lathyris TaxID=212925 RepID=UPI003313DFBD
MDMYSADFCRTEDAVGVLLEYLVDPKLPSKASARITPSRNDQESVAKQVHAVVLLYNYYHRKQHPQLEVLSFESFCKLTTIMRPTFMAFTKLMQLSNDTQLTDVERQLSLTEKKIMDACNICESLDASQNAPSIEGWPISKVSVFLIDSGRHCCWLKFGSATQGVWSLIEKDFDLMNNKPKGTIDLEHTERKKRHIRKPIKNVSCADDAMIHHFAFSAVEETTGIKQSSLSVLEKRVVYSMSKEKAAAWFYIMQCTEPEKNHVIDHPIRDAIDRLQGPLFMKSSSQWLHTSVVEYFHLLPYASVLSEWFSSEEPSNSLQVERVASEITNGNISKKIEKPRMEKVPKSSCRQHIGSRTETGSMKQNEDNKNYVVDLHATAAAEVDDYCLNHTKTINMDVNTSNKIQSNNCKEQTTSVVRCLNGSLNKGESADSFKRPRITTNRSIDSQDCNDITLDENWTTNDNNAIVQNSNRVDLEKGESADSFKRPRITTNGSIDSQDCNDITLDENWTTNDNNAIVQNSNRVDLEKVCAVLASKDQQLSQAALKVVLSKRARLCLQLRDLEDQIAQCDKNIQILNAGEGDLALKMQFLIEGCSEVSLGSLVQESIHQHSKDQDSTQFLKRKRSPDIRANNPCQELDDVCCRNNWILPRYCLTARDGGLVANVIVKGMNLEHSASGEARPHPHEARESAAVKMLAKLCNMPNILC